MSVQYTLYMKLYMKYTYGVYILHTYGRSCFCLFRKYNIYKRATFQIEVMNMSHSVLCHI